MKKILALLLLTLIASNVHAGQWRSDGDNQEILGTTNISDIDYNSYNYIVEPLDRLLAGYRSALKVVYNSASQLTVEAGEVTVSNSGGTARLFLRNTGSTTVTWSDIDTGVEASATTYYVYAIAASSSSETATFKISTNSSAPTGVTYYKRIASFYNNSSSDIEQISNDNKGVAVGYGTVANGGTISLPSGFTQDSCGWVVGIGSVDPSSSEARGLDNLTFTANSSRVVTATWGTLNWVDGSTTASGSGTANYIIVCGR